MTNQELDPAEVVKEAVKYLTVVGRPSTEQNLRDVTAPTGRWYAEQDRDDDLLKLCQTIEKWTTE